MQRFELCLDLFLNLLENRQRTQKTKQKFTKLFLQAFFTATTQIHTAAEEKSRQRPKQIHTAAEDKTTQLLHKVPPQRNFTATTHIQFHSEGVGSLQLVSPSLSPDQNRQWPHHLFDLFFMSSHHMSSHFITFHHMSPHLITFHLISHHISSHFISFQLFSPLKTRPAVSTAGVSSLFHVFYYFYAFSLKFIYVSLLRSPFHVETLPCGPILPLWSVTGSLAHPCPRLPGNSISSVLLESEDDVHCSEFLFFVLRFFCFSFLFFL